jgi:hypothetical protein
MRQRASANAPSMLKSGSWSPCSVAPTSAADGERAGIRRRSCDARKDVRRKREPGTGIASREVEKRVDIGCPWSGHNVKVCRRKSYAIAHGELSAGSHAEWTISDADGETGERASITAVRKRDERTERHALLLCTCGSSEHGGNKNYRQRIVEPEHEGNSEKGRRMVFIPRRPAPSWTMVPYAPRSSLLRG